MYSFGLEMKNEKKICGSSRKKLLKEIFKEVPKEFSNHIVEVEGLKT